MERFDPTRSLAATMRPMPFWSWNDRLEPEELKRQIREMHRAGLGGFFMHARGGLQTEYLGDAWLECVRVCVEEAAVCGMEAWLYDENGWPSGYAGGRVNGLGEDFQQKYLVCECAAPDMPPEPGTIGCYRTGDGQRIDPAAAASGHEPYYRITRRVNPCYIDVLNPAATDAFITATHQYYFDRLPPATRRAIRGIFTDEPQLAIGKPFYSEYFFAAFRARYDADPVDRLIGLWYDFPGAGGFRQHYHSLTGELFAANYTAKIHRWCREHGWQFTGHQVQEVDYAEQTLSSGAVSFHYPAYDMPGIDHLGFVEPDLFVARQMTSVAAQFGQSRRMVEMFACCGWQLTFAGMRWMYQLMLVYGINFLCLHLSAYSLRGLRKRDYPPSFGAQQPWFDDFRQLNDEFARQNQYASTGREFVRTLVIHTEHSVWSRYRLDDRAPEIRRFITAIERLSQQLAELQVPFHYGFEAHLAAHGRIEDDMLVLGACRYDTIVLPELERLTAPVLRLLRGFPGRIYRAPESGLQCEKDSDRAWFEQLPVFAGQLRGLFTAAAPEALASLRSSRRDFADGSLYLIANRERERPVRTRLHWTEPHPAIVRLDPATGAATPHPVESDGGFACELAGGVAWWLWCPRHGAPLPAGMNRPESPAVELPLPGSARIDGHENYLVLDRVRFRLDGGDREEEEDITTLQWRLLALRRAVRVEIDYPFRLAPGFRPDEPLSAALETPERFDFALNGNAFAFADTGYLFDRSNRRTRLPAAYLREGENRLTLMCVFEQSDAVYRHLDRCGIFETEVNTLSFDLELEAITLIGGFGVRCADATPAADGTTLRLAGPFTVCPRPESVTPERLIQDGWPFFAGKQTLETTIWIDTAPERFRRFTCRPFGLNSIRLAVNGIDCGYCSGEPWQIPLAPGSLRCGANRLTLEIVVPLRNLLGPLHAAAPADAPVGPGSFARIANPFTHGQIPDCDPAYRVQATGIAGWRLTGQENIGTL